MKRSEFLVKYCTYVESTAEEVNHRIGLLIESVILTKLPTHAYLHTLINFDLFILINSKKRQ